MQEKISLHENPLNKSVQYLKGVGPRRYELLNRLGVYTIEDILSYFPRRYEDRSRFTSISKLIAGEYQTVKGEILVCGLRRARKGFAIYEAAIGDSSGVLYGIWFNQPFMRNVFKVGQSAVFYGKVEKNKRLQMNSPEYEIIEQEGKDSLNIGRIVPVYPLTENITQRYLRKIIHSALIKYVSHYEESLPTKIRAKYRLPDLKSSFKSIHYPKSFESLELARRRLVFEEFFALQVAITLRRAAIKKQTGISHDLEGDLAKRFLMSLPFELTKDQLKVIREIESDMAKSSPMNRLLQGDVGSGKTVVAAYALALAIQSGYQGVLMVPTEILAEQHYLVLSKIFLQLGIRVGLLISGLTDPMKEKTRQEITSGKIQLIVGTHALIQEGVGFNKLGLIVIDEQHKFGVMQRAVLKEKGLNPDILVMTATPIPRTLALTFYGDMDASTIKELPAGRRPISTYWAGENKRDRVYDFIKDQLKQKRQAYIVCPLIEESKKIESKAATKMHERISEVFGDFKIGLLHGRMSSDDKEAIMKKFKARQIDILVTTVVIEVGIDVPNASVMVIENAERFGLSQLHQLRGRIGRGKYDSYCILISDAFSEEAKRRLSAMTQTQDGFKISEEDLALRGPGEFLGTRQSGIPEFKIADVIQDMKLLEAARTEAAELIKNDPELTSPENAKIKRIIKEKFKDKIELVSV